MSKGGRRNLKEAKGRGRPGGETPRAVIEHIQSIAPPSPLQDNDDLQFLSSPTLKKLLCSLCLKVASGQLSSPASTWCVQVAAANLSKPHIH